MSKQEKSTPYGATTRWEVAANRANGDDMPPVGGLRERVLGQSRSRGLPSGDSGSHEVSPAEFSLNRRQLVFSAGAVLGAGALLGVGAVNLPGKAKDSDGHHPGEQSDAHHQEWDLDAERVLAEVPLFGDARTEAAAEKIGVTGPMTYFAPIDTLEVPRRRIEEQGLLGPGVPLMPLFPPEVMKHSALIEEAAREAGINPNFLAATITVESAGMDEVISPDWGFGLGQITNAQLKQQMIDAALQSGWKLPQGESLGTPPNAQDLEQLINGRRYPGVHGEAEFGKSPLGYELKHYKSILTDPRANIRMSAQYLAECMGYAQRAGQTGLELLTHAAACYNGGPDEAGKDEDEVDSGIVLKYRRAMERMMLDVAVGEQLMRDGVPLEDILQAMQPTREANALMFAFGKQYEHNLEVMTSLDGGHQKWTMQDFTAAQTVGDLPVVAQRMRRDYENGIYEWGTPAALGMRWWLVNGGAGLLVQSGDDKRWRLSR